jgi:hypothetical protein
MNMTKKDASPSPENLDANIAGQKGKVFQVTFSDQSMGEMNRMSMEEQLKLVDIVSNITQHMLNHPREPLGRFTREGKTFYRVRADDLRCYFEIVNGILFSHYIIRKHTLTDFVFRFKLPVTEEQIIEQNSSFWKYLDTLTK